EVEPPGSGDYTPGRRTRGGRANRSPLLSAEHLADRGEQALALLLVRLVLGHQAPPLVLLGPGGLQRLGRVVRGEQHFAWLGVPGETLDGDVQQALLVEVEVHPLPRRLRREAQRPQVLVVDDLLAV